MKKFLLFGAALSLGLAASAQLDNYNNGDVVDDFTVTDVEGTVHNLYDYTASGKYVVLDFFFDTCGPCQVTTPIFNEFHEKYGCNEGDIIMISMNNGSDSDAEVIAFEETFGGNFSHADAVSTDGGAGDVDSNFGVAAYPTFVMIDPSNVILNEDIYPIANVGTFETEIPDGANVNELACIVSVNDIDVRNSALNPLYPNPTSGDLTLSLDLLTSGLTNITVVNLIGEEVLVLGNEVFNAGRTIKDYDVSDLNAGIYFVQVNSGKFKATKRLIVQ